MRENEKAVAERNRDKTREIEERGREGEKERKRFRHYRGRTDGEVGKSEIMTALKSDSVAEQLLYATRFYNVTM